MQEDFHYYATYCAAVLAGRSHAESLEIAYAAQLVDLCSESFLAGLRAPRSAATTQLAMEMADCRTDLLGLQKITRIWSSFHFLPGNLHAERPRCSRAYRNKYRLICGPNGALVAMTVNGAKGKGAQAEGLAMHVLADTWAHRNFAGTPSLVINNTDYDFWEVTEGEAGETRRKIRFRHNPGTQDDLENNVFVNSIFQGSENSIMNLGHGRAGHLPDYSFLRYEYLPAWNDYETVIKDNPGDYYHAFCQMVFALKALREPGRMFEVDRYDFETVRPYEEEIRGILTKRQLIASADWKAFGERLSGEAIPDFDLEAYRREYLDTPAKGKNETFLGRFILAALRQKSMVTGEIFRSGNRLAGFSVDFEEKGFRGIRDFRALTGARQALREGEKQ